MPEDDACISGPDKLIPLATKVEDVTLLKSSTGELLVVLKQVLSRLRVFDQFQSVPPVFEQAFEAIRVAAIFTHPILFELVGTVLKIQGV